MLQQIYYKKFIFNCIGLKGFYWIVHFSRCQMLPTIKLRTIRVYESLFLSWKTFHIIQPGLFSVFNYINLLSIFFLLFLVSSHWKKLLYTCLCMYDLYACNVWDKFIFISMYSMNVLTLILVKRTISYIYKRIFKILNNNAILPVYLFFIFS